MANILHTSYKNPHIFSVKVDTFLLNEAFQSKIPVNISDIMISPYRIKHIYYSIQCSMLPFKLYAF